MAWRGVSCHVSRVESCQSWRVMLWGVAWRAPRSLPLVLSSPPRSSGSTHLPPPAPPRLCHDLSCRGVARRVMSISHGESRPHAPRTPRRSEAPRPAAWADRAPRSPPSELAWSTDHAKSVGHPLSGIARLTWHIICIRNTVESRERVAHEIPCVFMETRTWLNSMRGLPVKFHTSS